MRPPMLDLVRRITPHCEGLPPQLACWNDAQVSEYLSDLSERQLAAAVPALDHLDLDALVLEIRKHVPGYGLRRKLTMKRNF